MSTRTALTFCRICEATCGLNATIEGDRVVALEPDDDHVVSKGYSCIKGLRYHEIHHSPDRLRVPLKRVDGRFEESVGSRRSTRSARRCGSWLRTTAATRFLPISVIRSRSVCCLQSSRRRFCKGWVRTICSRLDRRTATTSSRPLNGCTGFHSSNHFPMSIAPSV